MVQNTKALSYHSTVTFPYYFYITQHLAVIFVLENYINNSLETLI